MTRTQRMASGQFMAFVAFLLFLTSLMIESQQRGAAMALLIVGMSFFCMGGGATLPWRDTPAVLRALVILGWLILALAAVWSLVYKQAWVVTLASGVATVASVLAILGGWVYLRATREAEC
jgi:hypothetical protein